MTLSLSPGNGYNRNISDVSGSITIITQEDLDRQIASELTRVFRKIPGVSVAGSAWRPQNISVRVSNGFGADKINDKVGRFNFDLDDIKQIEVANPPCTAPMPSVAP